VAEPPLIYVSYGIVKSGSTLAFELTKALHELNGHSQPRLSREAVPTDDSINFVRKMDARQLEAIEREAAALGHPIVLKTHQPPTAAVKAWLAAGRIRGHCVYRDPREVCLSMLVHGARARRDGHAPFSNIATFEDTLRPLRRQLDNFEEWVNCPGVIPLYYDDVAFDTHEVIRRVSEQTGLTADPAAVELRAKASFTQFNKGVRGRFREMPDQQSARLRAEFGEFFAKYIDPREPPPLDESSPPLRPALWHRVAARTRRLSLAHLARRLR